MIINQGLQIYNFLYLSTYDLQVKLTKRRPTNLQLFILKVVDSTMETAKIYGLQNLTPLTLVTRNLKMCKMCQNVSTVVKVKIYLEIKRMHLIFDSLHQHINLSSVCLQEIAQGEQKGK